MTPARLALRVLLACLPLAVATMPAQAACPPRIAVVQGTSLAAIAQACGISVEALRQANPGLRPDTLQAGTTLAVPRPAFPSAQLPVGQQGIAIMPPLVPPAVGGSSPTVILPPEQPPIPQQHILRGFGDQPGQLPLPPGHSSPFVPLR